MFRYLYTGDGRNSVANARTFFGGVLAFQSTDSVLDVLAFEWK